MHLIVLLCDVDEVEANFVLFRDSVGVRTEGVLNQRVNVVCIFPGW
jgi:hypothetical protein